MAASLNSAIGLFFFLVLGIYLAISFSLVPAIMILNENNFNDAIKKSMFLIKDYWWFSFGLLIIIYIITIFSGSVFLLPQLLISESKENIQEGTSSLVSIFTVFGTFFSTLMYALPYLTIGFHYFSQIEKKNLSTDINFEDGNNQ